jgi:uncharacterized protein (TIGR02996 family)
VSAADFEDDGLTDPFRTLDPEERLALHGELTGDDLCAAVFADPDSDEPRLVYGDYLLEREDSRGEFIQLQLARGPRGPITEREHALFAAHVAAWCEPLFSALAPESIVFERGFLARCRAQDRTVALRDVIGHPAWLTVEELRSSEQMLIVHRCLRSLRRLATAIEGLAALAGVDHPVRLEHAEIAEMTFRDHYHDPWRQSSEAAWLVAEQIGSLVQLRSLTITTELDPSSPRVHELLASPLGHQLTSLGFHGEAVSLGAWDQVLRDHPSLQRLAVSGTSRRGGSDRSNLDGSTAVLERDARGEIRPILELGVRPPSEATIRALLGLPRGYRLTVRSVFGGALLPELVDALKRRLDPHFEDVIVG